MTTFGPDLRTRWLKYGHFLFRLNSYYDLTAVTHGYRAYEVFWNRDQTIGGRNREGGIAEISLTR